MGYGPIRVWREVCGESTVNEPHIPDRPLSASTEVTIGASAIEVFDWLSDLPRMAKFSSECQRCEWVTDPPGEVGATFRGYNRLGPYRWWTQGWVTTADRPQAFAFCTSAGFEPRDYPVTEWSYALVAVAGGTSVTQRVVLLRRVRLVRLAPILARLRMQQLRKGMTATLERLRREIEAKPASSKLNHAGPRPC